MKHDDIKIGEYYKFSWDDPKLGQQLIFIVGRDPFTGKLVATSSDWLSGSDLLEDDDYEMMEPI